MARAFKTTSSGLYLPPGAYQDGDNLIVEPMSKEFAGTYYCKRKVGDSYKDPPGSPGSADVTVKGIDETIFPVRDYSSLKFIHIRF